MKNKGLSEFTATLIIIVLTLLAVYFIYLIIINISNNQPMINYVQRMETKAYCPLANLTNTTLYCTDYMIFYDWNGNIINFTATPYSIEVPIQLKVNQNLQSSSTGNGTLKGGN